MTRLKLFSLLFFFIFNLLNAEEKIYSQNIDDWQVNCFKKGEIKNCEINQVVYIDSGNFRLEFKIIYSIMKKDNNYFEIFTIITPLGVNLMQKAALIFEGSNEQINIPFIKCETYGCIITVNNKQDIDNKNKIFKLINRKLTNSDSFMFAIDAFYDEPIELYSSLKGFNKSLELSKSKL